MKLSEAMKLGAMVKPKGVDELFTINQRGELASCAIGAAIDALYGEATESTDADGPAHEIYERFGFLQSIADCPACLWNDDFHGENVFAIVHHLNDDHNWTREQIADWVATIEPQDAETPQPVPVPVAVLVQR